MTAADRLRLTRNRRAVALAAGISVLTAAGGALALQHQPAATAGPPLAGRFAGVSFAGGEFAAKRNPARYGYDYSYPDAKVVAPFARDGFTAARLPFRWERLQPEPMGPLDERELARLDRAVAALGDVRAIILDAHNYARAYHQRLDRLPASAAWLADLWTKLAGHYRDPRIAYGIMNEPFGISAGAWRGIAEATVAAIRRTGARNLVLVPGTDWTGAHSWTRPFGNAAAMAGFRDPGDNFAFELHQYLDDDSSGTHDQCVDPAAGAARLAAVTGWLRREHARGVLAEFGAPGTPECLAALDALLGAVDGADDVWLGWTYWAAGGRWGTYSFSVQPAHGEAKPQLAVLLRHVPANRRQR